LTSTWTANVPWSSERGPTAGEHRQPGATGRTVQRCWCHGLGQPGRHGSRRCQTSGLATAWSEA
jgi:hypothetical protein